MAILLDAIECLNCLFGCSINFFRQGVENFKKNIIQRAKQSKNKDKGTHGLFYAHLRVEKLPNKGNSFAQK